jgi:hypothetical protein
MDLSRPKVLVVMSSTSFWMPDVTLVFNELPHASNIVGPSFLSMLSRYLSLAARGIISSPWRLKTRPNWTVVVGLKHEAPRCGCRPFLSLSLSLFRSLPGSVRRGHPMPILSPPVSNSVEAVACGGFGRGVDVAVSLQPHPWLGLPTLASTNG